MIFRYSNISLNKKRASKEALKLIFDNFTLDEESSTIFLKKLYV
jgi:hypothetical protein